MTSLATPACSTSSSSRPFSNRATARRSQKGPYQVDEDEDCFDEDAEVPHGAFSQEAQEIRRLELTGAMSHVVGETSVLSQEILKMGETDVDHDSGDSDGCTDLNLNCHRNGVNANDVVAITDPPCSNSPTGSDAMTFTTGSVSPPIITSTTAQDGEHISQKLALSIQTMPTTTTQHRVPVDEALLPQHDSQEKLCSLSQTTFHIGTLSQPSLGFMTSQEETAVLEYPSLLSLSQLSFQASQVSAMSVLMDAAELMSKSNNSVAGLVIPDSYANSQASTTRSKTSQPEPPNDQLKNKRSTAAPNKLQYTGLTAATSCKNTLRQCTVCVKATPITLIVKVPSAVTTVSKYVSNTEKRTPTQSKSAIHGVRTKATTFKSATRANNKSCKKDSSSSAPKRRKMRDEQDQETSTTAAACEMAQCAAHLAAQTIASPEVAKNLLLSMALVRINPRAAPAQWPPRNSIIRDGFFWGTYPPLETILRRNMREYYELSTTKCQSRLQQKFNNRLTVEIRAESMAFGWVFAENFDDKVLRDRIRCFFKTHIQNAKKRLRTMLKNPTKRANANALVAHLALIQRYSKKDEQRKPMHNPVVGDFVKVDVPDNVDQTTMRRIKTLEEQQQNQVDNFEGYDQEMDISSVNLCFEDLSQDDKLIAHLQV